MSTKLKKYVRLGFNITDHPKLNQATFQKKKWLNFKRSRPKRMTKYGSLLIAKQQLKTFYGNLSDRQISIIYKKAKRLKGEVGKNFLQLLEKRLDVVLWRLNFGVTLDEVRQLITHRHILVNNKFVNIPSYVLDEGDLVTVKKTSFHRIFNNIKYNVSRRVKNHKEEFITPEHLEINLTTLESIFTQTPSIEHIYYPFPLNIQDIIQYYEFEKRI